MNEWKKYVEVTEERYKVIICTVMMRNGKQLVKAAITQIVLTLWAALINHNIWLWSSTREVFMDKFGTSVLDPLDQLLSTYMIRLLSMTPTSLASHKVVVHRVSMWSLTRKLKVRRTFELNVTPEEHLACPVVVARRPCLLPRPCRRHGCMKLKYRKQFSKLMGNCSKVTLMVALWWCIVSSARYEFKHDWKVFNSNSLKESRAGQGYGNYRLLVVQGAPILGDNGTVGLAFLNLNGTGHYFLSVLLAVDTAAAIPIWTANRDSPVSEGAALQLLSGEMRLIDSQGNRAWSPFKLMISGMEVQDSGNFRLFDDQDSTLWQSFDDTTDVLMPGQTFQTGSQLIGNANKSTVASGSFVTKVEASGLALYLTTSDSDTMVHPQPYSVSTMQNTTVKRQLSTVLYQCPGYQAGFSYSGADFTLQYERTGSNESKARPCSAPRKVHFPFVNASLTTRFLRLEYTGDLVSYGYDPVAGEWKADFSWESLVQTKTCPYPLSCGVYGMCQSQGSCKCLSEDRRSYDDNQGQACSPPLFESLPRPGACDTSAHSYFVDVLGVSYFSNKLLQPDTVSSLDSCLSMCKSNCSCSALFYDKDSRSCFFVDEVLGSLDFDAASVAKYSAHLKFHDLRSAKAKHGDTTVKLTAGILVPLGVIGIAAAAIGILWLSRMRELRSEAMIVKSLLSAMPGSAPPHRFTYKSLSLATKGFTQKLGSGGFGSVFAGKLPNGTKLAVKRLEMVHTHGEKEFAAEVVSLGSVSHINIVRLCGFCVKGSSRLLVYELVANGSLDKWLFDEGKSLTWSVRMGVAVGTARGLAYLHEECREPILHLDVKPQNILLDEEFGAKVADFGMSKLLASRDVSQVTTGVRGTPGYVAPEWIMNSLATKKCDVYSFGMVLLELVSGRKNIEPGKVSSPDWYYPHWVVEKMGEGRTMDAMDARLRTPEITEEVERVLRIALCCIQENAAARPSMNAVVDMLEGKSNEMLDLRLDAIQFPTATALEVFESSGSLPGAISAPSLLRT